MMDLPSQMLTQAKLFGRSNGINQVPTKNDLLCEGAREIKRLKRALKKALKHSED